MAEIFKKIEDETYQAKIAWNYENNHEFKTFIEKLKMSNYDFSRLNQRQSLLMDYFKSAQLCQDKSKTCEQEITGFRKTIFLLNDTIFLTLKRCIHSRNPKLLYHSHYIEHDFPEIFMTKSFKDVKNQENQERYKLLNYFNDFLSAGKNVQLERGFYLSGPNETGKTFLTVLFMNRIILQKESKILFIGANKIIQTLKNIFASKGSTQTFYNKLVNAPYLVIDNLGLEYMSSYFRDDFFFILLNDRFNQNRPTFFISPYKLSELKKLYTFSQAKNELVRVNAFFQLLKKMVVFFELNKTIKP